MLIVQVSVIGEFMFKKAKKKMVDSPQILAEAKVLNMQYGSDNTPFFVLGCVRSGTTLLRDILKLHTRLESPEETHFFRWADPYASPRYERNYVGVKLFKNHQEIDGVSVNDFITSNDFNRELEKKHLVEFGFQSYKAVFEIEFNTKEQPAFNRQFELLIKDLKAWEAKKFQLNIFAENPKQLERLQSIFDDLKAEIVFNPITSSIHEGFIDEDLKVVCYTDHQIFQRYHKYKVKQAYNKNKAITLRTLRELQPGDFVTHLDHGVGIFSGLQKLDVNGRMQEAVRLIYKDTDILYVNINSLHKIAKYTGKDGSVPKVNKLGSDVWNKLKD